MKGRDIMSVFRVEKIKDYTVMSNHHLRDKRLSLKAKGLLSQILSLPEDWDYTMTGLSVINRERKDAIRTAIYELEQAGYIERHQTTDEFGRFSSNEYVIHEVPIVPLPSNQPATEPEPETEPDQELTQDEESAPDESFSEPSSGNPTTAPLFVKPLSANPMTGNTLSENTTQLNKDIQITDKQNTDSPNTDSFIPSFAPPTAAPPETETDGRKEREAIRAQIEYAVLVNPGNREQLDELVELMVEVHMNRSPTIRFGREAEYPTGYVRDRFRRITSEHIEKVLDGIRENTTHVRNTRGYLMSALFNSVSTLDNHYTMLVNHDHNGG